MHKVVITGLGVVAATGADNDTFWAHLATGKSGIGALTRVVSDRITTRAVGEIPNLVTEEHFGKEIEMLDRSVQLALICGRRALAGAGLPERFGPDGPVDATRVGVITGTGMGGITTLDAGFVQIYGERAARLHPFLIPRSMYSAASSQIGMATGARGPSFTISTACASASHALGEAWRYLRHGAADVMLAGGCDAPLTLGVIKAWEAMRVLAIADGDLSAACRPFSRNRTGLVLAEGAAIFILETEAHARGRGATILAELAGYGATADAGHITQPSVNGAAGAMAEALRSAGLQPTDVDYINAHGTGTKLNDSTEIAAIKQVFGESAAALSISSTKSMHGHAMGASGAVELAATVMALQQHLVPPTINYSEPDPECDLDVTPNRARARRLRAALSNSFAFGGLNAVLAVRGYQAEK